MHEDIELTPAQVELQEALEASVGYVLEMHGWVVLEDMGVWRRIAREPGGDEAWLNKDGSVQPVVEPPPGTRVYLRASGTTRTGTVVWRGPGHIRATWVSASGNKHEDLVFTGDYVWADAYDAGRAAGRRAHIPEREA